MRAAQAKPVAAPVIPDKLYFRIGDVAELCGVETYVLRFWETEFPPLKPNKSGTGQRLYRKREVEYALRLKQLLHEQGYTIAGAKLAMNSEQKAPPQSEMPFAKGRAERARLDRARQEARELLALLSSEVKPAGAAAGRKKSPAANINLHRLPGPELFS